MSDCDLSVSEHITCLGLSFADDDRMLVSGDNKERK